MFLINDILHKILFCTKLGMFRWWHCNHWMIAYFCDRSPTHCQENLLTETCSWLCLYVISERMRTCKCLISIGKCLRGQYTVYHHMVQSKIMIYGVMFVLIEDLITNLQLSTACNVVRLTARVTCRCVYICYVSSWCETNNRVVLLLYLVKFYKLMVPSVWYANICKLRNIYVTLRHLGLSDIFLTDAIENSNHRPVKWRLKDPSGNFGKIIFSLASWCKRRRYR